VVDVHSFGCEVTWLSLLVAVIKGVGMFAQWLHDSALISSGEARASANALRNQADALQKAAAAREAVRADHANHPDSVFDDDGFRRK
jgi:hypothetical protein